LAGEVCDHFATEWAPRGDHSLVPELHKPQQGLPLKIRKETNENIQKNKKPKISVLHKHSRF
jgi:hypothetical protein